MNQAKMKPRNVSLTENLATTHQRKTPEPKLRGSNVNKRMKPDQAASAASSSRATIFVILIIGFTAGPAVSL